VNTTIIFASSSKDAPAMKYRRHAEMSRQTALRDPYLSMETFLERPRITGPMGLAFAMERETLSKDANEETAA
jgi:hypothetical protein